MADIAGAVSLEDSLVHLSARFYRAMIKHITRELLGTGLEISAEQWHVLILLRHRNGQTQKELARRLYKDKTTIAKLVATMESGGMVDRKQGLKDRREKKVFITEKGVDVMDGVTATVQRINELVEAEIDEKERALCRDVLRRVHMKLNLINGIHGVT